MFEAVLCAAIGLAALAPDRVAQAAPPSLEKLRKPLGEATATMRFDIAPQSLPDALAAYDVATGFTGLYATEAVVGRSSGDVHGAYTAAEALRRLLAPSGLSGYFTAADAYVLEGAATIAMPQDLNEAMTQALRPSENDYPHVLQAGVRKALCRNRALAAGGYRAALSLSISASGKVERPRLLDTTGSKARDAEIIRAVDGLSLPRGPADPAQSFVILILPHTGSGRGDCESVP